VCYEKPLHVASPGIYAEWTGGIGPAQRLK
jgi:hypothetical protein